MRRRRPSSEAGRGIPLRLLTFRAEEWPPGMTRATWWDARRAWVAANGVDLPSFGPDDMARSEEWSWRQGRWATPDDWRAELHAWEDEHDRLLAPPHAPFEPSGRGMYDLGTAQWEPL